MEGAFDRGREASRPGAGKRGAGSVAVLELLTHSPS
jgi:hypothetical protein